MSRADCISNRNIKIISTYAESLLGETANLFEGIPYPGERYKSAKDYLADEDEWTPYETFEKVFGFSNSALSGQSARPASALFFGRWKN